MYAVIECGGKQYKVQEGDLLKVEKLNAEVGASVSIEKVLLISDEKTTIGAPYIEGAKVSCKVLNQDKDKKILVYHYKAKKNIRKTYGHRQPFTSLLVQKIEKTEKAKKVKKADAAEQPEVAEA